MIRIIKSELYKFATTPGPWLLVLFTAVLTALVVVGLLVGNRFEFGASTASLRSLMGSGHFPAQLLAPIVGVLCITTEYRHKVLTTTLLATPKREQVLMGKTVASIVWSLLLAATSVGIVAAVGVPWVMSKGVTFSEITAQIGPVLPGLVAVFVLFSLFGLGIGTLVKNQVAGVLIVIGGTLIVEPILTAIARQVWNYDLNWLPSEAASAVAGLTGGGPFGGQLGFQLLTWWEGVLVLLAWCGGSAAIGYFTTLRRDVT